MLGPAVLDEADPAAVDEVDIGIAEEVGVSIAVVFTGAADTDAGVSVVAGPGAETEPAAADDPAAPGRMVPGGGGI